MSGNNTRAAILDYWRAIELFSPQNIPRPAPNDRSEPVYSMAENRPMPWSESHPLKRKYPPKARSRRFQIYCGIFKLEKVKTILEDKLGKDPESFDERTDGENCLFSFSVTDDGRPLFDSFVLSTCVWATARTLNPGPGSKSWLEGFESCQSGVLNKFSERCAISHDDERGQELKGKGFNLGRSIEYNDIITETQLIVNELGVSNLFDSDHLEIRIRVGLVASRKKYSTDDQDFLNSFFVKDIGKVAAEIRKGNIGKGLSTFLTADDQVNPDNRIDVRKSIDTLFQHLSPSLFPSGRWPSKGHHPLVFSQQFAVNSAVQQLMNGAGIFSVNGPPGTGKTTLLRDLVASIVVERARRLSELRSPGQAFTGSEKHWKTGGYNRVISLWKDEFKGFEIVVASYNNGAVENITLEIPGIDAIDPSWLDEIEYFPDIAYRLIGQPAWAMVAARLGNKTNRGKFVSQFWYGKKDEADDSSDDTSNSESLNPESGLLTRLKELESQHVDWEQAANTFKDALAAEEKIREERAAIYKAYLDYFSLLQEIPSLESKLSELVAKQKDASRRLKDAIDRANELDAILVQAKQDRLDNHRLRPGFIEIIFSLGKRFREWSKADDRLKSGVEIAERKRQAGFKTKQESQQEVASLDNEIGRSAAVIKQKRESQEAARSALKIAQENLGAAFPTHWNWQENEDGRERSSPWSDPEWDKARAKVFLSAMALHKLFLIANADTMRKNLQGAMDVLSGAVPEAASPEGIESAWATLFFVIPVISTTFASFDRLFTHLGRDALGWLLIDEAGQAAPQAAVGAIWRSKRSVVVGDPLQLEPVVTIPFTVQQALRKHYGVEETWLPGKTSVQQLADRINRLGTYVNGEDGPLWVGSPLRVHRRCDRQMFDISNKIAYDGLMVFGTSAREPIDLPESTWIDVVSQESEGHWIPAEGQEVEELIRELIELGIPTNEIFLISPFRVVVRRLLQIADRFGEVKVGTIHTVQGKESEVVILVLGGNPSKPGAKQWASKKPNLLNVAASRAKRRLYVVGNREAWKQYKYFSVCAAIIGNKKGTDHNGTVPHLL
ncbi:MAG TPA: AAA domain-containing protein [Gallionella sp.]|nr:AAA domain-containing protein [Gallionella sp.]